jgi:2'-5' RNA ligase
VRLFVAVQPPDAVLDALVEMIDGLRRRDGAEALRWVDRPQLHVTLRFLGEVPDAAGVVEAMKTAPLPVTEAEAGPGVTRLGRQVLCVPVTGLDALASEVAEATAAVGPLDDRPFRGHLTLARARGRGGVVARSLAGAPVDLRWPVADVHVVRSHLGPDGPRYEALARFPTVGT